ncbi:hypothetical protein TRVL_08725 [Trypanosoma vivax]|nr:hypothetical protein TRVL_08725 [Trypanosoma vivax]
MLTNISQTIADPKWNIFLCALRAFVEQHVQASFSFDCRPRAGVGVAHVDGFLRLENGELLLFFENKQVKFMVLRNAMVSELSESGNFIRAFETTKECFQNEWRTLGEGRSALFQHCESARLQIHEERQHLQAHFAAVDCENNDLKQRICQPEGQMQHILERTKVSRPSTEHSRLSMAFGSWEGPKDPGNARRERAKERTQQAATAAVRRDGFPCAHYRRTAAAAGK